MANKYTISTSNNIIKIEGATGFVKIYNLEGRDIQSETINGIFNSKSLNAGFYIVNINGYSTKVVL